MTSDTEPTWQRAKDVVEWIFRLPPRADESPVVTWRRAVVETLALLAPFARATHVSLTTESTGDRTAELSSPESNAIAVMLEQHPDGVIVYAALELVCFDADGNTFAIPDGARLTIDRETDDGHVDLVLALRVDIYAWRTRAANRDNTALADRNAPLLARFLADVQSRLGGEFDAINNSGYDADENGFVRPV